MDDDVSTDEVAVCRGVGDALDCAFDVFLCFWVKDVCEFCDEDFAFLCECFGLACSDVLLADFGVGRLAAGFVFALAPDRVVSSARGLAVHASS